MAGLNILQPETVTTTTTPLILRPFLKPPTAFPVARAGLPESASIGQILMTLSSTGMAPAKEAEYVPPEGKISKVARFPRFVPTKQQMLE